MDPTRLLEQFLGGDAKTMLSQGGGKAKQKLDAFGGVGGFAGGAAAGGLLGVLLGSKKVRKMAGGAVGYGCAAALAVLAYKAYQNWQQGKAAGSAPTATAADLDRTEPQFLPDAAPAADGQPFELTLVRAMIGAAKADGHVDAAVQARLFEQVDSLGLDAEAKGFVFDALGKPVDLA